MDAPSPFPLSVAISLRCSFKLRSWHRSLQWVHVSSSPFPPLGPLGEGSPASAVLWLAPIPRHPSPRTSYSFVWRYRGASLGNAGQERRVPTCADFFRSASRSFPWRCRGLPGSWGVLVCMPLLKGPRRGPHHQDFAVRGGSLPEPTRRRPSRVFNVLGAQ